MIQEWFSSIFGIGGSITTQCTIAVKFPDAFCRCQARQHLQAVPSSGLSSMWQHVFICVWDPIGQCNELEYVVGHDFCLLYFVTIIWSPLFYNCLAVIYCIPATQKDHHGMILPVHKIWYDIYIYIFMSRDPHTPPPSQMVPPPPVAGEGGFLSSQAMVYVVFIVHIMHMYR